MAAAQPCLLSVARLPMLSKLPKRYVPNTAPVSGCILCPAAKPRFARPSAKSIWRGSELNLVPNHIQIQKKTHKTTGSWFGTRFWTRFPAAQIRGATPFRMASSETPAKRYRTHVRAYFDIVRVPGLGVVDLMQRVTFVGPTGRRHRYPFSVQVRKPSSLHR